MMLGLMNQKTYQSLMSTSNEVQKTSQEQAKELIDLILETFKGSQILSEERNCYDTDPFDPEVHTDDFF